MVNSLKRQRLFRVMNEREVSQKIKLRVRIISEESEHIVGES